MEELKPCPFCGSEASFTPYSSHNSKMRNGYIGCSNPDCVACIATSHISYGTDEAAIKAWNTRAQNKDSNFIHTDDINIKSLLTGETGKIGFKNKE